jgi:hypothetical protein
VLPSRSVREVHIACLSMLVIQEGGFDIELLGNISIGNEDGLEKRQGIVTYH